MPAPAHGGPCFNYPRPPRRTPKTRSRAKAEVALCVASGLLLDENYRAGPLRPEPPTERGESCASCIHIAGDGVVLHTDGGHLASEGNVPRQLIVFADAGSRLPVTVTEVQLSSDMVIGSRAGLDGEGRDRLRTTSLLVPIVEQPALSRDSGVLGVSTERLDCYEASRRSRGRGDRSLRRRGSVARIWHARMVAGEQPASAGCADGLCHRCLVRVGSPAIVGRLAGRHLGRSAPIEGAPSMTRAEFFARGLSPQS